MKEESLSDKIIDEGYYIPIKDVKEKIQNAQKRLKAPIKSEVKEALKHRGSIAQTVQLLMGQYLKEINKIFLEEFGEKILKK